jgi:hypothetical protein
MNRRSLPHELFEKLYYIWISSIDQIVCTEEITESNDGFCFQYRQLGWDMKWDDDAKIYTLPEKQLSLFLLKYGL